MREIDDRPPPRAEDYLDPGRRQPVRDDRYDANDNQQWQRPARPVAPPPDDYRVNAPAPSRRHIVEEPLPY